MTDIFLVVLGAILGWIGQWAFYRYQRRDEGRQGPNVVVSKIVQNNEALLELRNVGIDSLSEMEVKVSWLQDHQHQERKLEWFFRPDQDIRQSSPSYVEILGPAEQIKVQTIPQWTDDGLIDVQVTGLGVKSQRLYSTVSQIAVALPSKS